MIPLIVYDSMTGNVQRFVSKLTHKSVKISKNLIVNSPYILITYTIGYGQIPSSTKEFLNRNSFFLMGVASSGNKNWGSNYARSADLVSIKYSVPIVHKFELSGTEKDLYIFNQEVEKIVNSYSKVDSI